MGGGLQVLLGLINARVCRLIVLWSRRSHCSYLFLHMVVKQGHRRRGLGLGLYRCTTSEVCWVLGGSWLRNDEMVEREDC